MHIHRALLAAPLALLLTVPEASAQLREMNRGGIFGQTATGNELSVVVTNVWDAKDAYPLAEAFCAQYGKLAKFTRMDGYTAAFDCVKA